MENPSRTRAADESSVARSSSAIGTRPAPRLVVQEDSLSETVFGERVPLSSTMKVSFQIFSRLLS